MIRTCARSAPTIHRGKAENVLARRHVVMTGRHLSSGPQPGDAREDGEIPRDDQAREERPTEQCHPDQAMEVAIIGIPAVHDEGGGERNGEDEL